MDGRRVRTLDDIGGSSTAFRSFSNSLLLTGTPSHLWGRILSINGLNPEIATITTVVVGAVADATNVSIALSIIRRHRIGHEGAGPGAATADGAAARVTHKG